MYVELLCDLLLTSDLSPGMAAGLRGRPSTVLDGSSAWARVSETECLARQSGAVSAASASIRTNGGKKETGEREFIIFIIIVIRFFYLIY